MTTTGMHASRLTAFPEPPACCGRVVLWYGGIGIGLAAAGYRVIKAYDSWPDATAIYNHNAPGP